jgi:dCTP diphosphatase
MLGSVTTPDLDVLTERLRQFAAARDWERFHSPKNLVMALAGEVGELVAELQWLSEEESALLTSPGDRRNKVVDEVSDVAIYLLRFCDVLEIDIRRAISARIEQNEGRLPPNLVSGRAVRSRDVQAPTE